ncbi:MAG: bifunctional glutamate N-acetyltransferase/amino-acid acetyltransferase ArgJ [Chloroflexi bacterium]|nr:bifunctional glutamate N-acetyltransferase/amino-acid acetyltransferase ArgJ [Chloroflexota bacterium]
MEIVSNGTITSPKGFRACGITAGIKASGKPDMAMIVSDSPCAAGAVFTQNRVQAAPVQISRKHIETHGDRMQAIVINAGNANAVTGRQGLDNATGMAASASSELDIEAGQAAVMSTGVIGQQLPMEKVTAGIKLAIKALSYDGGHDAARAIMTTDTQPKEVAVTISGVTIGGICKGAAMIHPNMATMLCIIATDAQIDRAALQAALSAAVKVSFNRISVDGDTSTNDTVIALANGLSGIAPDADEFQSALTYVCTELAKKIVRDAEGASKFITLTVRGAASEAEAHQVAATVATSPLVKTAIYGRDANWGRVLAAAGRSGVAIEPSRVNLRFGPLAVLHAGTPLPFKEDEAIKILSDHDIEIDLDLGMGDASVTMWTCDLTHEYVSLNADYRT